jgi:hypothetical protein
VIKHSGRIENFWENSLETFVFPKKYSAGQRDTFHKNYSNNTNDLPQAFDIEIPNCIKFKQALNVTTASISWTCIEPGQAIPIHTDAFYKLRQQNNVDVGDCLRYLIFLQDWQLGHFVEFEELIITKWTAGDVWVFDHTSQHCAANASNSDFITCQVNTIK